eukprot:57691-Chlamydomonas_euryale.AAC.2
MFEGGHAMGMQRAMQACSRACRWLRKSGRGLQGMTFFGGHDPLFGEACHVPGGMPCSGRQAIFREACHVPGGMLCSGRHAMFREAGHIPGGRPYSGRQALLRDACK